jgi:hypothetical protein
MQVRSSAAESMIVLTKILSNELQKDYILPLIKKLATNMREEEQRIEAAEVPFSSSSILSYLVPNYYFIHRFNGK